MYRDVAGWEFTWRTPRAISFCLVNAYHSPRQRRHGGSFSRGCSREGTRGVRLPRDRFYCSFAAHQLPARHISSAYPGRALAVDPPPSHGGFASNLDGIKHTPSISPWHGPRGISLPRTVRFVPDLRSLSPGGHREGDDLCSSFFVLDLGQNTFVRGWLSARERNATRLLTGLLVTPLDVRSEKSEFDRFTRIDESGWFVAGCFVFFFSFFKLDILNNASCKRLWISRQSISKAIKRHERSMAESRTKREGAAGAIHSVCWFLHHQD